MTNSGIFIYELNNHSIYCSNVHYLNFSAKNYGPENISWRYLWLVSIKDLNSKRIFVLNLECCQKKCCLKEILLPCNKFKKHWRNKLDILKSLHFLKSVFLNRFNRLYITYACLNSLNTDWTGVTNEVHIELIYWFFFQSFKFQNLYAICVPLVGKSLTLHIV